jgi:hypothetical protein
MTRSFVLYWRKRILKMLDVLRPLCVVLGRESFVFFYHEWQKKIVAIYPEGIDTRICSIRKFRIYWAGHRMSKRFDIFSLSVSFFTDFPISVSPIFRVTSLNVRYKPRAYNTHAPAAVSINWQIKGDSQKKKGMPSLRYNLYLLSLNVRIIRIIF